VKDGKITVVSDDFFALFFYIGPNTEVVNLWGKTLTPGFVDAHSHFGLTAVFLHLNFSISSPPFGNVTSIVQILQNVKDYIAAYNVPAGHKVYGYGYSDHDVAEHRHPTRYELDSISAVHPIILVHYSGHLLTANSLALAGAGYQDSSPNPAGGFLDHYPNGTLTGVVR
jgi:predicted amidohydrolase YtcJ